MPDQGETDVIHLDSFKQYLIDSAEHPEERNVIALQSLNAFSVNKVEAVFNEMSGRKGEVDYVTFVAWFAAQDVLHDSTQ